MSHRGPGASLWHWLHSTTYNSCLWGPGIFSLTVWSIWGISPGNFRTPRMRNPWNHLEIGKYGKNQNWDKLLKSTPNLHETPENWSKTSREGYFQCSVKYPCKSAMEYEDGPVTFFDLQILIRRLPCNLSEKATEGCALQREVRNQDTADLSLWVKQSPAAILSMKFC